METAGTDTGHKPKTYSLNMFKDFVPMCVFSEANQGEQQCANICCPFNVSCCIPFLT